MQVKPLGPVPVKGLERAGRGVRGAWARAPCARGCRPRPRAGSRASWGATARWTQLRQALERARRGHGQVVAVVGEPGVGKSRLFCEFTHSHRTPRTGSCSRQLGLLRQGDHLPPVIDLLEGLLPDRRARRRAQDPREGDGKLLALDRALEPRCRPSCRCSTCRSRTRTGSASTRRSAGSARSTRVKRLLLRESQVQPLLVGVRGSALDRRGDPGAARQPGREPARRPACCCS